MTVTGLAATTGVEAATQSWASAHRLEIWMTALLLMVAVYTILGGMLSCSSW